MKCYECDSMMCEECGNCDCHKKWKDIWKEEPPRNTEILFMTGNENIHVGMIYNTSEKLRKCGFFSFKHHYSFDCDLATSYEDRVIYWYPLPEELK